MKRVLINVLVLACAVFTLTAQPTRHEVKVGNFSRLVVTADVNVDYRCNPDSAGLAVMYCEQSVADHFIFSINKNGRLNIQLDNAYQQLEYLPKVTVYSSSLEEAENASDSTLRIIGLPRMASFKVMLIDNGKVIARGIDVSHLDLQILSGKGKIIAQGHCDDLAVRLVGTGEIQADDVRAENVTCRIMGTGRIGCHVDGGELKVSGSGTGKVYCKGTPTKVSVRKLGTIKAIPM